MRKNRVKAQNGRKWRENTEKEKAVNKKKKDYFLLEIIKSSIYTIKRLVTLGYNRTSKAHTGDLS